MYFHDDWRNENEVFISAIQITVKTKPLMLYSVLKMVKPCMNT